MSQLRPAAEFFCIHAKPAVLDARQKMMRASIGSAAFSRASAAGYTEKKRGEKCLPAAVFHVFGNYSALPNVTKSALTAGYNIVVCMQSCGDACRQVLRRFFSGMNPGSLSRQTATAPEAVFLHRR